MLQIVENAESVANAVLVEPPFDIGPDRRIDAVGHPDQKQADARPAQRDTGKPLNQVGQVETFTHANTGTVYPQNECKGLPLPPGGQPA